MLTLFISLAVASVLAGLVAITMVFAAWRHDRRLTSLTLAALLIGLTAIAISVAAVRQS